MYSKIIAVCSDSHTKHINTLCGQNVEFLYVKTGETWSNWQANGYDNFTVIPTTFSSPKRSHSFGFTTKTMYILVSPQCHMPQSHSSLWFDPLWRFSVTLLYPIPVTERDEEWQDRKITYNIPACSCNHCCKW